MAHVACTCCCMLASKENRRSYFFLSFLQIFISSCGSLRSDCVVLPVVIRQTDPLRTSIVGCAYVTDCMANIITKKDIFVKLELSEIYTVGQKEAHVCCTGHTIGMMAQTISTAPHHTLGHILVQLFFFLLFLSLFSSFSSSFAKFQLLSRQPAYMRAHSSSLLVRNFLESSRKMAE